MHKDLESYMKKIYQKIVLTKKDTPQKAKKINTDDIIIPSANTIDHLFKYNYNLAQLKMIARHYKLKQGGNKNEVFMRIFYFFSLSRKIVPIQRVFRGYIQRTFHRLRGPGLMNRSICVNESDFLSMEPLTDICHNQFYSFVDEDDFVYGFDLVSLYNLLFGDATWTSRLRSMNPNNPYNRRPIAAEVISNVKKLVRLGKLLKTPVTTEIEQELGDVEEKTLEMRANELFQNIDQMGHYTNADWFISLNLYQLRRFVRELTEIWNYREGITREAKREICPPHGDPFRNIRYVTLFVADDNSDFLDRQKMVIEMLERLTNSGINEDSKCLGAYYVLGSLTLVNRNAALAMPWLYDSFKYN